MNGGKSLEDPSAKSLHLSKRKDQSYLPNRVVQRKSTHGEDLADLNDDKTEQKQLHLPVKT
jgi:hypothetical protein